MNTIVWLYLLVTILCSLSNTLRLDSVFLGNSIIWLNFISYRLFAIIIVFLIWFLIYNWHLYHWLFPYSFYRCNYFFYFYIFCLIIFICIYHFLHLLLNLCLNLVHGFGAFSVVESYFMHFLYLILFLLSIIFNRKIFFLNSISHLIREPIVSAKSLSMEYNNIFTIRFFTFFIKLFLLLNDLIQWFVN